MGSTCCRISTPMQVPQINIICHPQASETSQKKPRTRIIPGTDKHSKEAVSARVLHRAKSSSDTAFISSALRRHFVFKGMSDTQLNLLVQEMRHFALEGNAWVLTQNEMGSNFYIVISGALEVSVSGRPVRTLHRGNSFGELSLLHNTPRSSSVRTLEPSTMWGIDRQTFRFVLESLTKQSLEENIKFIETVPIFSLLKPPQVAALAACMLTLHYSANEVIINQGDLCQVFYILKEGTVVCSVDGKSVRQMTQGDFFGEQSLIHNSTRTATVSTLSSATCLAIQKDQLALVLGQKLKSILYKNSFWIAVENSPFMGSLTPEQVDKIYAQSMIEHFKTGDTVIPAGNNRRLWVVVTGALVCSCGEMEVSSFKCIGDKELTEGTDFHTCHQLLARTEADLAIISYDIVYHTLGGSVSEIIKYNSVITELKEINILRFLPQNQLELLARGISIAKFEPRQTIFQQGDFEQSVYFVRNGLVQVWINNECVREIAKNDYFGERALLSNGARSATIIAATEVECYTIEISYLKRVLNPNMLRLLNKRIHYQDHKMSIEDLGIVSLLGKGTFGNVFLTMHKKSKELYALKTVHRSKISAHGIQQSILNERESMMLAEHPMVVKLISTFKDETRLYFLIEYVEGIELFEAMKRLGLFEEKAAKFYFSCTALVLDYLHSNGIIYRDLKPENMIIDVEGYPKLIDFGSAKVTKSRTFTFVGTPHYLAPEVILNKGYDYLVDYWGLGIMLYELMTGEVPFGETSDNPLEIYEAILQNEVVISPVIGLSLSCKTLVKQLLSKDPLFRKKKGKLTRKSWVKDVDWNLLNNRQVEPPFKPDRETLQTCNVLPVKTTEFIAMEETKTSIKPDSPQLKESINIDLYF